MITRKLREDALLLRRMMENEKNIENIQKQKNEMLEEIYKMLTIHLGTPPTSFDWQIKDRKKKLLRFEGMTPQSFYENHVGLNLDDYVCLINCPMSDKEYNKVYTVKYLGNVVEGNQLDI